MEGILDEVVRVLEGDGSPNEKLLYVCRTLQRGVPHYDWVGFYIVDPKDEGMLYLGPYVGAPTEHVRIPFGKGICGQAAARKEAFIIQDVAREDNYLSCSINVRSEIVIPVMDGDEVIGELDIDSHSISPFGQWDRALLERICDLVGPIIRGMRLAK